MSRKNVEVVRGMCDAFTAGDLGRALDTLDPEVVWHDKIGGPDEGRVAHGHDEVIEAFTDNLRWT